MTPPEYEWLISQLKEKNQKLQNAYDDAVSNPEAIRQLDRAEQLTLELTDAHENIAVLRNTLRSIAENYDHEEQAHREGRAASCCRVCIAERALQQTKGVKESLPIAGNDS